MRNNRSILKKNLSMHIKHWHMRLLNLAKSIDFSRVYSITASIKLAGPGIIPDDANRAIDKAPFFSFSDILCLLAVVVTTIALLRSTNPDAVYAAAAGFVWIVAILVICRIVGRDKDDKIFDLSTPPRACGPDA